MWHEDFLYKFEVVGIWGSLYKLFQSVLSKQQERVVLNGQQSNWTQVLLAAV